MATQTSADRLIKEKGESIRMSLEVVLRDIEKVQSNSRNWDSASHASYFRLNLKSVQELVRKAHNEAQKLVV